MAKAGSKVVASLEPLTGADEAELLQVLASSVEPLEVAKLLKLVQLSRRATAVELQSVLQRLSASGQVVVWPAKTLTGRERYWDRDVRQFLERGLRACIQTSDVPLGVKELKPKFKAVGKALDELLEAALVSLVASGEIYLIPGRTVQAGSRYWGRDVLVFAGECVLAELRKRLSLPTAKLRASVKWLEEAQFLRVLEHLSSNGQMFRHPSLGGGRKAQVVWGVTPPAPEPWLQPIGEQLREVVQQLRAASVAVADLRRAAVQMLEAAGISLGGGVIRSESAPEVQAPLDLLRLMREVEPGADRGALVTVGLMRSRSGLSKAEFDGLVMNLAREGRIVLHRHDFAAGMSDAAREELVSDGEGGFYVGMAFRVGQVN